MQNECNFFLQALSAAVQTVKTLAKETPEVLLCVKLLVQMESQGEIWNKVTMVSRSFSR